MTREIPLTRGFVAIVDDEDYERVSAFKWHVVTPRRSRCVYAVRQLRECGGKVRAVYLHRFILGLDSPALQADHIDGDGLNNRRANLRAATASQNMFNSTRCIGKHGFRGVDLVRGRFVARIGATYLGRFDAAEEAVLAYDAAARAHFGEFGRYNFPREGEQSALRPPHLKTIERVG